jgi:hypothetical protein
VEARPVRSLVVLLTLLLPATGALAQGAAPTPDLETPDIEASQQPEPTPQGTRSPEPAAEETDIPSLWDALAAVYRAPPDLDGSPISRPNPLGSNPEPAQEPSRSPDPSDSTSNEVK